MRQTRRTVTILDIARLAGVSKSTVSRALTGAPNISEEARVRIEDVIRSTGYRGNDLARSLRSGRSGMVGLVIPDISNPFWAEVARGAQDAAARQGSSVLIFNSDWNPDQEHQHLQALLRGRVDGAIVNPVRDGASGLSGIDIPLVLIGSSAARFPELPSVGSDIEQGVALGLDRLAGAGLGLPAFLAGDPARSARERFLAAARRWAAARGLSPELRVETGDYTVEGGRLGMRALLAARRPRAVFAANDLMALGAMQELRAAGLACPEEVAVLGFDGIPAGEVSAPALTTVVKPARQIGYRAHEILMARLNGGTAGHETLACTLCERESLPRLGPPLAARAV